MWVVLYVFEVGIIKFFWMLFIRVREVEWKIIWILKLDKYYFFFIENVMEFEIGLVIYLNR